MSTHVFSAVDHRWRDRHLPDQLICVASRVDRRSPYLDPEALVRAEEAAETKDNAICVELVVDEEDGAGDVDTGGGRFDVVAPTNDLSISVCKEKLRVSSTHG